MEKSADSVNFHVKLTRTDKNGKDVVATDKFVSNNARSVIYYLQNTVDPGYGNSQLQGEYFNTYIDENDSVKYKHVKGNVFNVTYNIKRFPGNLSVEALINPSRDHPLYLTLLSGADTKAKKAADEREAKWLAGLKAGAKYTLPRTGKAQAFYMSNSIAGRTNSLKLKTVKIDVGLDSGFDMQAYQAKQRGQIAQMPERFVADEAFIAKHADKIIRWYKDQAFGPYFGDYVKIFDIKHVKGRTFQVKYNMDEEMVDINILVSPDDSGNHPIELDDTELLVSGRVIGKARTLPTPTWAKNAHLPVPVSPVAPQAIQLAASLRELAQADPAAFQSGNLILPRKAKAASPKAKAASPKAKAASPKAKVASPKSPRGCTLQTDKKYADRKSPAYPANECCGATMAGNDGKLYKSVASKNGVCRWTLA